ncbi:hypothetical protein EV580_6703 [Mycobacterium sp. BK086]|uniref:hypothetical protein n=1 Tax=Mycobacterium sp. BK086 TaxID=2512165 RepID=UPI001061E47B|nr:hypothetical protein [Mycobacterium sp. BK086]TDO06603.1 hypothetical protein EV580_6703 [Mycobacterium sp. BK086]
MADADARKSPRRPHQPTRHLVLMTRHEQLKISLDGMRAIVDRGGRLSNEYARRLDAMLDELRPTELTSRLDRDLHSQAKHLHDRVHAGRLPEARPAETRPTPTVVATPHLQPSTTQTDPDLFPVLAIVEAGTKPAKLAPKFTPREGSETATIQRLAGLRSTFLSATPFTVEGDVAPRPVRAVLLPPFDNTWIEWRTPHYRVGAHITRTASHRLAVSLVISDKKKITFYDQPDMVMLDATGIFIGREEFADQLWSRRLSHQQAAFTQLYDILAYLNQPHTMREEVRPGQYRVPAAPRTDERTVLIDVTATTSPTHRAEDHKAMPLHNVRGHVRHDRSGKEIRVKPYPRGNAANGTNIGTYRVQPQPPTDPHD